MEALKKQVSMTVAILLEDLKEIKEISTTFKRMGISPFYYQDIRSFWEETISRQPSLSIVDVAMMGQHGLVFKEHPLVKKNSLPIIFYHSDQTIPLVRSTYGIFHYGLLRKSSDYAGQLKAILNRYNMVVDLKERVKNLKNENKIFDDKISHMLATVEKQDEDIHFKSVLQDFSTDLYTHRHEGDFHTIAVESLGKLPFVEKITFMEPDGGRLISPPINHEKYQLFRPLKLELSDQIGFFEQNTANQMVLKEFGGETIPLVVKDEKKVRKIFFIKVKGENVLFRFQWPLLEQEMNRFHSLFEKDTPFLDQSLPPWELFSLMDDFFYGEAKSLKEYVLIDLDFSRLIAFIGKETGARFYWKRFFHDFSMRIKSGFKEHFHITSLGMSHVALLMAREQRKAFLAYVKSFCRNFSYWRYFSRADFVFTKSIEPKISIVPFSTDAYLQILKKPISEPEKIIGKPDKALHRPGTPGTELLSV